MKVDVVVDVGNSRIKWGRCSASAVVATASLPPEDPAAWSEQAQSWRLTEPLLWVLSGVQPHRRAALTTWLQRRGARVYVIEDPQSLPVKVLVDRPEHVGIDRLLDAVAANSWRPDRTDKSAVIVDAGSAVTVDCLDPDGAFTGGAIFPGLKLMADALHQFTALLPAIAVRQPVAAVPGKSTPAAMQVGVYWAVAGGVRALIEQFGRERSRQVFLTGGDAAVLQPALPEPTVLWPEMTLEGLRRTAEALP